MGEAKIFLFPCETNILHPVIRIEVTDSGDLSGFCNKAVAAELTRKYLRVLIN